VVRIKTDKKYYTDDERREFHSKLIDLMDAKLE